jgi:Cytochrome c7 and related cytochrome c
VALPTAFLVAVRTPFVTGEGRPIEQPIPFDHRHHVRDDGIDCRYCHDLVERTASAGVPPTERCLNCHSQIWSESPLLQRVWESRASDRPIPWRRVYRLPGFVYFDHSVHVSHGVGCFSCHGAVDGMARVYQAVPLTMRWCLDCHRDPAPHLRPQGRITAMEPAALARAGRTDDLPEVHPGTDCTTCHR